MREFFITDAPAATVLVRVMTGSVFLSEGIQKFLYPADLAAGRFTKIGIPSPEIMGPTLDGGSHNNGIIFSIGQDGTDYRSCARRKMTRNLSGFSC
jgi:uncharacterized membrane protein YphA (DoxX/SURF4 family)